MTKFWVGEEGIPRGLKPYFLAVLDARAKARAYLRSNSKGNRGSFDSVTRKARVTSLRMTRFWLGGGESKSNSGCKSRSLRDDKQRDKDKQRQEHWPGKCEVGKRVSPLRCAQKRELNPNEQVRSLGAPFASVEMTILGFG